jgi:hypothetical protein
MSGAGGYSQEAIDRFALSRDRIHGGEIKHEMALKDDRHVGLSLDEFYAIGCEMQRLRRANAALQSVIDDVQAALDGCG